MSPHAPRDADRDRDAYVEVLIAAAWEKQGEMAAARIMARLDEPFLAPDSACAEIERRIAALAAFARDESLPRLARLERGLDGIAAAGADQAHAAWRARAVAFWPALRVAVDRDHRAAWLKLRRIRDLYARLDPIARAAVDARIGPILDADGRTHPALRGLWPGDRLRAIDARAAALSLRHPARGHDRPRRGAA